MPAKKTARKTAASNTNPARTVIYCHGIGNKPAESVLRSEWDRALFGFDQGERTRMAYWVDRERYPQAEIRAIGMHGQSMGVPDPELDSAQILKASIANSDDPKASQQAMNDLAKALKTSRAVAGAKAKGIGPLGFWTPISEAFTKLFLADVNDFLFYQDKRERMVQTVLDRIKTGGGPFVVLGHSQGTMIAYEALLRLPAGVEVPLLVTLGSPLALPPVVTELKKWHGTLKIPACVKRWVNVAGNGDVVCADQSLADAYKASGKTVEDFKIPDFMFPPTKAHATSRYFSFPATRSSVMSAVDKARFQHVGPFTIAKDLAKALDEGIELGGEERQPVLIELADRATKAASTASGDALEAARSSVESWIIKNIAPTPKEQDRIQLEVLDRYVAALLTRSEVETLSGELGQLLGPAAPPVYRVFRNSRKTALMLNSIDTIQARTAQMGYRATGKDIVWAVLDSGVDKKHPHFAAHETIAAAYDCTKRGQVVAGGDVDANGHGTHVAGIIAGAMEKLEMISCAPQCKLHTYKVLDDDGSGNDAWIIKAIDHIWAANEKARRLVIHGVNLSLGGPFDSSSFGCGDSPLCSSLRRLFRQGVLVVLAAGNEGIGEVIVGGYETTVSFDLSIGDPANLEEGIAVGSVHPVLPHRYGTSYFSSRGPTADGRVKPDVVAPGEGILSCRSGGRGKELDPLYVKLSGTSMAAPHVSGLLAGFLSAKREFIGEPAKVKEILLANCTDLKRDRYHQGAGLPNLTRMLLTT